ncbi:AP2/ERF domain-containing protein, partial [Haematococcus lacustris]
MYDSEEAAAQAWDKVAWVYRGKAQGLNFAHLVPEYDTEESKRVVHEMMDERMSMHKPRGKSASAAIILPRSFQSP